MRSTVLGCLLLLGSPGLAAEPGPSLERLEALCDAGLGEPQQTTIKGCALEVERASASMRLRSGRFEREVTCLVCTNAELEQAAHRLGVSIHEQHTGRASANLELPAIPSAGRWLLDNVPLNESVHTLPIAARPHILELRSDAGSLRAHLDASPTASLIAVLDPGAPAHSGLAWRPQQHLSWSMAALGSGLTLGAVGGFLLWQDGRCAERVTASGFCGKSHELTGPAVAFLAVGAVLEAVAVWWLWPRRKAAPALRIEARP